MREKLIIMKRISISIIQVIAFGLLFFMTACRSDIPNGAEDRQGAELKIYAGFGGMTRVAELPNTGEMSVDHNGLYDVGLYIYYSDDYNLGDLRYPYVRNLRCKVVNGELIVVTDDPAQERIFIYDRMTLVAFYPFNEEMSEEANFFSVRADEENYPVTRKNYEDQTYIPYRAQTTTDPTVSFYTSLTFLPKHTYKVEIVLVADDESLLPSEAGMKILPGNDSVENGVPSLPADDGKREEWYDKKYSQGKGTGGSAVVQYTSYIWTTISDRNRIQKGDILLQNDTFTLIASQDVNVAEQYVYRYGYNLSTGEMFIPTSSSLINNAETLAGLNGGAGTAYQVCDIDLAGYPWTPISVNGGRVDGGGHRIENMTVTSDVNGNAGLFGQVQGNTTLCNIILTDPVINVTSTADTVSVGALAGKINPRLTDEERNALVNGLNLPPGLSEVVKQAMIAELLAGMGNSQTNVVAVKVDNPTITVNGKVPHVGALAGSAGDRSAYGEYKSSVRDSYVSGGSIMVNQANTDDNAGGYVAGFIGLNNGSVSNSYTTTDSITAMAPDPSGQGGPVNIAQGFTTQGGKFSTAEGGLVNGSFAVLPNSGSGVGQLPGSWPSWPVYTDKWPATYTGWLSGTNTFWYSLGNQAAGEYPTLQWERK